MIFDLDTNNNLIPIVRTTTMYKNAASTFLPILDDIIKKITSGDNLKFNNALIEISDNNYRSMTFHSDQSLDLDDDSYMYIFIL